MQKLKAFWAFEFLMHFRKFFFLPWSVKKITYISDVSNILFVEMDKSAFQHFWFSLNNPSTLRLCYGTTYKCTLNFSWNPVSISTSRFIWILSIQRKLWLLIDLSWWNECFFMKHNLFPSCVTCPAQMCHCRCWSQHWNSWKQGKGRTSG